MNTDIPVIPLTHLALAFLPVLAVLFILYKWSLDYHNALYALARMLVQLLLIGYGLSYLFNVEQASIILVVLIMMISVSSWIALNTVKARRKLLYTKALYAISLGGGIPLFIIVLGVVRLDPWYTPSYLIPLASMIFSNSLNSVSLAAERFITEIGREVAYEDAKKIALRASLIPITNSLFAVGLVSLPGMMTGQILSGVSPLIAARYQIMVMAMIFASAGLSAACFLVLIKPYVAEVLSSESEDN